MGYLVVTDKWRYNNLTTVILENDLIKVVIIPEVGGKLENIIYKPQNIDFLWHNPRIETKRFLFIVNNDDCRGYGLKFLQILNHIFAEKKMMKLVSNKSLSIYSEVMI